MTDTAEIVDGTVVPDEPEHEQPTLSQSLELAPRQRRSEVIRPLDPDQLVDSFKAYQNLLPKLLDASDYQAAGRDKKFVKKSGWRKVATAFDLDVVRVTESVERDEHGQPVRAMAVYRAIAPSGRSMDGDGYCSVDEDRFSGPRGNKGKLEHDLRSTAVTRAKNRAIADLVGMGEVSAEEVDGDDRHAGPPFGPEVPQAQRSRVGQALYSLLEIPGQPAPDVAPVVEQLMKDAGGYFPAIVAKAILRIDKALADRAAT